PFNSHFNDFYKVISDLVRRHPHPDFGESLDMSGAYITLEGIPMSSYCSPIRVVITPKTTVDDFSQAILQLRSSRFVVSLSWDKSVDFAQAVDDAIPWGPRYGDVAFYAYHRNSRRGTLV